MIYIYRRLQRLLMCFLLYLISLASRLSEKIKHFWIRRSLLTLQSSTHIFAWSVQLRNYRKFCIKFLKSNLFIQQSSVIKIWFGNQIFCEVFSIFVYLWPFLIFTYNIFFFVFVFLIICLCILHFLKFN